MFQVILENSYKMFAVVLPDAQLPSLPCLTAMPATDPGTFPFAKAASLHARDAVHNHPYQHSHACIPRQAFSDLWLQRSCTRWQLSPIQVHLPLKRHLHTALPTPPHAREAYTKQWHAALTRDFEDRRCICTVKVVSNYYRAETFQLPCSDFLIFLYKYQGCQKVQV